MPTTYNFASQEVLAGTMQISIIVSGGGSTVVTVAEKYFSDELNISYSPERKLGELQSPYADFSISRDKDSLFRSTILPNLYVSGTYVFIRVTINNSVLFYGHIEPKSINYDTFYSADNKISNPENEITFRAIWIFDILKFISKETLRVALYSDAVNIHSTQWYQDGYFFTYIKVSDVIDKVISLLSTLCSIDINLVQPLKNLSYYGLSFGETYYYPSPTLHGTTVPDVANFKNISPFNAIETDYKKVCLLLEYHPTAGTNIYSGIFADDNDSADTAYDFLVSYLRYSQLFFDYIYYSNKIYIKLVDYSYDTVMSIDDIISCEETPISEYSPKELVVSSKVSGNEYKIRGSGFESYNIDTIYDFGSEDFSGIDSNETMKSLFLPSTRNGKHCLLPVRSIGLGKNAFINSSFGTIAVPSLTEWDITSGSWVAEADASRVWAKATVAPSVASGISQSLNTQISDGVIVGGIFKRIQESIVDDFIVQIFVYDSGGNVYSYEKLFYPPATGSGYGEQLFYIRITPELIKSRNTAITSVLFRGFSESFTTFYLTSPFCVRQRETATKFMALELDRRMPFTVKRKRLVSNGLKLGAKHRRYFTIDGINYLIDSIDYDIRENETTIEGINYPV